MRNLLKEKGKDSDEYNQEQNIRTDENKNSKFNEEKSGTFFHRDHLKMEKLIARYGLGCNQCDAGKATLANDDKLRAQTTEMIC